MENASKALIIAGAILISILLISVGIMVMNSIDGIKEQEESQMSQTEITAFNRQFSTYSGQNKGSATVKSLYEIVTANNAKNSYTVTMKIGDETVSSKEAPSGGATTIAGLSTRDRFDIVIKDTDNDSIYDTIEVTKK